MVGVPNPRAGPEGRQDVGRTEEPIVVGETMGQVEESGKCSPRDCEECEGGDAGDFITVQSRKRLRSKGVEVAGSKKPQSPVVEVVTQVPEEKRGKQLMLELEEKKRRIQEKL